MRTQVASRVSLAALASVLVLAGCDDSDPVAPPESSIILSASPSDFTSNMLDPNGAARSNITAVVLDTNSIPLDGVAVFFSTDAGTLDSQSVAQTTDDNGIARDVLVTTQSAQVTAQSGDAMEQVTVTVAGVAIVETVVLNAQTPLTGTAPLTVEFSATVTSSTGNPIQNQVVTVTISGDGILNAPNPLLTNQFGIAEFEVQAITQDGTTVTANAGGKSSLAVEVNITPP
jgi:hypothetical protein